MIFYRILAPVISLLAIPYAHGAVGNPLSQSIPLRNPLSCGTVGDCVSRIIDGLFTISIPIVTIMILYGGFQIMTARGNVEQLKSGRNTILYAAIGFVVVLLSKSVVLIIQRVFGVT